GRAAAPRPRCRRHPPPRPRSRPRGARSGRRRADRPATTRRRGARSRPASRAPQRCRTGPASGSGRPRPPGAGCDGAHRPRARRTTASPRSGRSGAGRGRPRPSRRADRCRAAGPRASARRGRDGRGREWGSLDVPFLGCRGRPGHLAPRAAVGHTLSEGGGGGLPPRHPVRQATDCRALSLRRQPAGRTTGQALAGTGADVLDWRGRKAVTAREGASARPQTKESSHMAERRIGIIVNGATGRMGYRQHLVRSLLAIREQGGVELADGDRLVPDLLLVGRNEEKLRGVAEKHGLTNWTTDVDEALATDGYEVYFDALVTNLRVENLKKAIAAGKAIYTEKPTAESFEDALELARLAKEHGTVNGVVHDK